MMKGIPLLTSKQIKSVIVLCQVAVSSLAVHDMKSVICTVMQCGAPLQLTLDRFFFLESLKW